MATVDRLEPPAYTPWSPTAAGFPGTDDTTETEEYVGRHRRRGGLRLGLRAMRYVPRHSAAEIAADEIITR